MLRSLTIVDLNPHCYPLNNELENSLQTLCICLNTLQISFKNQLIITSGLRSQAQQDQLIKIGKSTASKSKHILGQAADISDPNGKLKQFINSNMNLMCQLGLWFEDFSHTSNWVHAQIVPYASWTPNKARFFIP